MKKLFVFGLSLAMLLSLAACGKPQAEQQDTSQPDPAPVVEPKPEPKPEQPPVTPVKKDTPKPAEEAPAPDPVESVDPVDPVEPEEPEEQPSDASQAPQTQDQPKLSAKERVENSDWYKRLKEEFPTTWVDDTGCIHCPVANESSGDIMG